MFLGAHARFQVFLLKIYVLVCFSLYCIEDKYSRFISDEHFHLMFPVSFSFRIQISGTVVSHLLGSIGYFEYPLKKEWFLGVFIVDNQ